MAPPQKLISWAVLGAIAFQKLLPYLLPHGPAVDIPPHNRPDVSGVDPANTSLRLSGGNSSKIYERVEEGKKPLLKGAETIVFDYDGVMYAMSEDSKLVSLTDFQPKGESDGSILTAKATEVADLGPGRPLGGKFDKGGCLYFADAILGLARICDVSGKISQSASKPKVELIASSVKLEDGSDSRIAYADDVDIGLKTGHIYFSDASDIDPDRDLLGKWDTMYASKTEFMRGMMTGRLLRYRPETGDVDVLATGLAFANGVAVDKHERFVLVTSTFDARVVKYHLMGPKEGEAEVLLGGFPGFLDGADCSPQRGVCYVAIPSSNPPIIKAMFTWPSWVERPFRSFLMMIPRTWAPAPVHYGAAAEFFPGDESSPPRILRVFQDPDGRDIELVTGVTEHEGKLYMGSLYSDCIGVVSLE